MNVMQNGRSIWLFFASVFLLPLGIYAMVSWYQANHGALPVIGNMDNGRPHTVARFELLNQDQRKVGPGSWKNRIVVANFFFTHCPVICPKMMANLKSVQQAFGNDDGVAMASFSVDPERDSCTRLKEYASRFGITSARWDLLTGPKQDIYRLARKSFLVTATDGDGGANDFIHSDKIILIDKQLRIRGFYPGTDAAAVEQLLKDIKRLKNEN